MKVVIGGDFCPINRAEKILSDGKTVFSNELQSYWNSFDFRIANLECPITDKENKILKSGPNLKSGSSILGGLQKLNISAFSLANNHIMDYDIAGLKDTCENLDSVGVKWFGIDKESVSFPHTLLEKNGVSVAIFSYSIAEYCLSQDFEGNGARAIDLITIVEDIRKMRKNVDHLIILLHTGLYQLPLPTPRQREICHFLVRNGVSAVLCQHSHICGAFEYVNNAFISYGQGSFLFDLHKKNSHWNEGYLVKFDFTAEQMIVSLTGTIQFSEKTEIDIMDDLQQGKLDQKLLQYNKILIDKVALKEAFQKAAMVKKKSYYGLMTLPSGRLFSAFSRRFNIGKLFPAKMKRTLLNLYRNEEHNELIQEILKTDIK